MQVIKPENQSYALKDENERARRIAMQTLPHMLPLTLYLKELKQLRGEGYDMPSFDPCDGGIYARILILLEAPGPKAIGSGFISRNNPDSTARNINVLLQEADIPREDTIIWNIIPWYIGDGKRIRGAQKNDVSEARPYLESLLKLLPNLDAIVLMGKPAQSAAEVIRTIASFPIFSSPHPSPRVFNIYPEKKLEAQTAFYNLGQHIRKK